MIPLEGRSLLQILEPNNWVDQKMAEQFAEVMVELLTNDGFDDLSEHEHFPELPMSRMGYGDPEPVPKPSTSDSPEDGPPTSLPAQAASTR